jgi:hypothetical protein
MNSAVPSGDYQMWIARISVLSAVVYLIPFPGMAQNAGETASGAMLPMAAAVRVLAFASYMGGNAYSNGWNGMLQAPIDIIDPEHATQKPVDPVVAYVDYVRSSSDECTFDRRDFVPITADRHFARSGGRSLQTDYHAIWHTQIDFRRLSNEWRWDGLLHLSGNTPLCKFESKVPTSDLEEAQRAVSSRRPPPDGTQMRCVDDVAGVASVTLRTDVIRAVSYMHAHVCPAFEMPF